MNQLRELVKHYIQTKNYEVAIKCCEDALELDSKEAYLGLGYIHYRIACGIKSEERSEEAKKSEEYFLKVLEIDSNNIDAMSSLARLYEIVGNFDLCKKYYEMSLAIAEDPVVRYNYKITLNRFSNT